MLTLHANGARDCNQIPACNLQQHRLLVRVEGLVEPAVQHLQEQHLRQLLQHPRQAICSNNEVLGLTGMVTSMP